MNKWVRLLPRARPHLGADPVKHRASARRRRRELTRVTVDGEANNTNFLEVTVNRPGAASVLSWARIPYDS